MCKQPPSALDQCLTWAFANETSLWVAAGGPEQMLRDVTAAKALRWAVTGSFVNQKPWRSSGWLRTGQVPAHPARIHLAAMGRESARNGYRSNPAIGFVIKPMDGSRISLGWCSPWLRPAACVPIARCRTGPAVDRHPGGGRSRRTAPRCGADRGRRPAPGAAR